MKIPQIPLPLIPQNFPVYQDQPGIVGYEFTDPGEPPPPLMPRSDWQKTPCDPYSNSSTKYSP